MYRPYGNSLPNASSFVDVESTIRGLSQDLCTAFNTGNYDQVTALFAMDGFFIPPRHEAAQGKKAIEQLLRECADAGYEDLRLETIRVDYSGDMAVEVGRYAVAIRQQNGTAIADRGRYVHSWRRLGAWLLTADCWSSSLPTLK
ncbi:MAG TPA: nuclear transport factor 2 family protein [Terriglobales bacterium]|nr:nuclear transport factor 2 family protein [Terriglobales bacterium]